jgi:hypothetical protein
MIALKFRELDAGILWSHRPNDPTIQLFFYDPTDPTANRPTRENFAQPKDNKLDNLRTHSPF